MKKNLTDDISEILLDEEAIRLKIAEHADSINRDYYGKDPVLVAILKGSVVFLAALLRKVTIKCSIDFMVLSSYKNSTESSGVVKLVMDLGNSIEGRHVIVIEDIIDTGLTMDYLVRNLGTRNPASLSICTLLSKPSRRKVEIDVDYPGIEIPDKFIVGFGLDYKERYRNLPYIATLKPEIYRGSQEKEQE